MINVPINLRVLLSKKYQCKVRTLTGKSFGFIEHWLADWLSFVCQMASSVVLRRHISDIIKCPICLDVLDAPTSLPCLHTFSLRCLRTTFAADYPGDVAACPICRQDFELPAGGPSALPKNFTLDGLVELNRSASVAVTKTANDKVDKFTCSAEISGDVSLKGREPTHSEMKNDMTLKTAENSTDAAEVTAGSAL